MSLKAVQTFWYERLKKEGFNDIEDTLKPAMPLNAWSGLSLAKAEINGLLVQEALTPVQSNFPEPVFNIKEQFMNYQEFNKAVIFICKQKRKWGTAKVLTETIVKRIWELHCDGISERKIEKVLRISDYRIHNVIATLKEWMRTMADLENNIAYDDEEINEKPMVIITRAYDHSIDAPFVFASWRNSIWFDKERNESVASEFFRLANREMKNLIAQPNCKIKIACAKDDSTFIIGYSVMCDETIEWVYVKEKYRNKKIASLLVAGFNTVAEPSTIIGESIVRNKKLKIKTRTKEARELGIEISRAPEFRG